MLGARNLHGHMMSVKTLAAESSSCGGQCCHPHGPDVGLTHLSPAAPDLQRISQPISAKHTIVGLEGGWKSEGPLSAKDQRNWQV